MELLVNAMSFPDYYSPLSLHLSAILGTIGVSEELVNKRRRLYLETEATRKISCKFYGRSYQLDPSRNNEIYLFGSQIECSTTPGLRSDADFLHSFYSFANVMQSKDECQYGVMNLLMVQDGNTPYGHCRLLIKTFSRYDSSKTEFLPNAFMANIQTPLSEDFKHTFKHGPSNYVTDHDCVYALKCQTWPNDYLQHLQGFNGHSWPSPKLVKHVKETGFFLVPVGHAESDLSFLEWRISTSLAERMLVFSFNITQLKCLVLLKMLKKTYFEPVVGDGFSSYHCKTVLFYTIMRTSTVLWREDMVFACLQCCLNTLACFLQCRFCPQIFNPKSNLFSGKLLPTECESLRKMVSCFQNEHLRCILGVKVDNIGERLLQVYFPCDHSITDITCNKILIDILKDRASQLHQQTSLIFGHEMWHLSLKKCVSKTFRLFEELLDIIRNGNGDDRVAARLLLPHFCGRLASYISAYRIKKKQPITEDLIEVFRIGFQTDASSTRLKLASAFHCNGQHHQALDLLNETQRKLDCIPLPVCSVYLLMYPFPWHEFYDVASEMLDKGHCIDAFTTCVRYSKHEVWICPLGMRRSVVDSDENSSLLSINHLFGTEVDSKALMLYLQFLTYRALGKHDLKLKAQRKLIECVNNDPDAWKNIFLDLINSEESMMLDKYTALMFWYPDKETQNFHSIVNPENQIRISLLPFGKTGLCICYTFRKCSSIQHMDMTLNLVAYSFELEAKKVSAVAFYWMSNLIEPSNAVKQHIIRLHSPESREFYIIEYNPVPEICFSLVNMLAACNTKETFVKNQPKETFKQQAVDFCAFVAVLLQSIERQKADVILSSMYEWCPPLLLIESRRILPQLNKSLLDLVISKFHRFRSNGRLEIPKSELQRLVLI